jgi:hypothetical protein
MPSAFLSDPSSKTNKQKSKIITVKSTLKDVKYTHARCYKK